MQIFLRIFEFSLFCRAIDQNKTDFFGGFGRAGGKEQNEKEELTLATTYGLMKRNDKNRFFPDKGRYIPIYSKSV